MDPVLQVLRDLVAIESVNPTLAPGGAGEGAAARWLAEVVRAAGLDVQVTEAAPGRPNVVATLEGRGPGRTLLFCGHLDTVGVAGMAEPFAPVERGGRLYGRGTQDMKGGVAAMVDAACRLARSGGLARGRVVVAAVADEEYGSLGARALVRDLRADAAVVTEPTDLAIGIGHKGFAGIEVVTRGVAAHGSLPETGRDAILRMGRVLGALEQFERTLRLGPAHPRLGRPSLHASTIAGGTEWSRYPDACVLRLERRLVAGEDAGEALREVTSILAALRRDDGEFEAEARLVFSGAPYEIDALAELPQTLARVCAAAGQPAPFSALPFWTDAAILGGAGIPSVLFGPGGAGMHTGEEYVETAQVVACRDRLVDLAREYC
jgi:acetylornithine deacetylase